MRHLALENARSGVTANTVALGLMDNQGNDETTAAIARTVPVGRLGSPEDIGALVVYLASDESAFTAGEAHVIDGGWSG